MKPLIYKILLNQSREYHSKSLQLVSHVKNFHIEVIVVGKTSLIQKFVNPNPKQNNEYNTTVGVEFSSRQIEIQDSLVQIQIWDTCGHDLYRSMTSNFYRGACCVFLVFALNDRKSFENVQSWYNEFQESGSPFALIVIIGTKSDMPRQIETFEGSQLMKKLGGIFYVETSAQTGQQISELFSKTAQLMYKKYKISHQFRVLAEPRKHLKSSILVSGFQQNKLRKNNQLNGRSAYSEGSKETMRSLLRGNKRRCC